MSPDNRESSPHERGEHSSHSPPNIKGPRAYRNSSDNLMNVKPRFDLSKLADHKT
jgi:hypothetical protein